LLYSPLWFEKERDIKAVVKGYDAMAVTGVVLQCMRALRRPGGPGEHDEVVRIKIDSAGGYGTAVVDMLRYLQDEGKTPGLDARVQIIEVNVGEASTEPEKYPRLRSEVWFSGRKFLKAGGAMYPDPGLEHELIAPIYKVTPKGQLEVEQKKDTKKRLGRSPDRADSALLAIYEAESVPVNDVMQPIVVESRWANSRGRGFG
jgi:hypothetical protein